MPAPQSRVGIRQVRLVRSPSRAWLAQANDHHKRHDKGQTNEPHQKAHEKPSSLGKSGQPGEGRDNEKEFKHLVHPSLVSSPPCGLDWDITTQDPKNVIT